MSSTKKRTGRSREKRASQHLVRGVVSKGNNHFGRANPRRRPRTLQAVFGEDVASELNEIGGMNGFLKKLNELKEFSTPILCQHFGISPDSAGTIIKVLGEKGLLKQRAG